MVSISKVPGPARSADVSAAPATRRHENETREMYRHTHRSQKFLTTSLCKELSPLGLRFGLESDFEDRQDGKT